MPGIGPVTTPPIRLKPTDDFDWSRVAWGKPDSPRSRFCSYCFAVIPDDAVPLMLWKDDGHAAQFCDACCRRYWRMR